MTSPSPLRVFLSHTSELAKYPAGDSFIAAAKRAVERAGHAVVEMDTWTAATLPPAELVVEKLTACDIYVGVIGFRYGSPVRGDPTRSYTELEFDTAGQLPLPRLVFLLDEEPKVILPRAVLTEPDRDRANAQEAFRTRINESQLTRATIHSPSHLETLLQQALTEKTARIQPPWRVRVGQTQIPPLASAFQTRPRLRERIETARAASFSTARGGVDGDRAGGVVLTQVRSEVLSGGGGVGKSQLAASYAVQAIHGGTELVVWADASTPGGLVATFAEAAGEVQAPHVSGQPDKVEADARAFLDWVAVTERSWLVVLDDITDPDQAAEWWPASHTGTGWVLATTRRRDAVLSGAGRRMVDVDVYEPDEATAYLTERLTAVGKAHLLDDRVAGLAEALGWMPLALSHAAAFMIDQRVACGAYLDLFTAGVEKLDELMPGDPDGGRHRPITITLLLALDAADAQAPVGLARPAIGLAAVLDPAGHPEALWATQAVLAHLRTHRTVPDDAPVTPGQARSALLLLDRYGLATFDEQAGLRAVRVHALTARAARETTSGRQADVICTAADALLDLWPEHDHEHRELAAVLLANTTVLIDINAHAGGTLWTAGDTGHPLLPQAGRSWHAAGLRAPAAAYWERTVTDARHFLGMDHPVVLNAQANLGYAYWQAGRTSDAINIQEQIADTRERLLGPEHPQTFTAWNNLANSYRQAGRTDEAIKLGEKVAAGLRRLLPEHPRTYMSLHNLASSYGQAGRLDDAIIIMKRAVAGLESVLGPRDPSALTARSSLGALYGKAGRTIDAIAVVEPVADIQAQVLGREDPSTLISYSNLASYYRDTGRLDEAIDLGKQVADARGRVLGRDHPDTLRTQNNLASSYWQAGRTDEAIAILEQVAADRVRVLGAEHSDTQESVATLSEWRGVV